MPLEADPLPGPVVRPMHTAGGERMLFWLRGLLTAHSVDKSSSLEFHRPDVSYSDVP